MEDTFDEGVVLKELTKLPRWKAYAFGLAICERMLPGFTAESGHTGRDVLRSALWWRWTPIRRGPDSAMKGRACGPC